MTDRVKTSGGRKLVMRNSFMARPRKSRSALNARALTTFTAIAPSKPLTQKDSKQGVVSWWTIGTLMLTNTVTIYILISHTLAGVTPTSLSLHYNPSITLLLLQFVVPSFRIITSLLLLICQQVSWPYCC